MHAQFGSKLTDRQNLEAAYIGFRTLFNMALKATSSLYTRLATIVPSTQESEQYKWMGDLPTMKKWIGERNIQKLRAESQTIVNEDWANGLEVDRNDLRADRLGIVSPQIAGLAQMAVKRMDAEVIDHYVKGFAATRGTTYDGQYLYDTDHTAAGNGVGTSQSNKTDALLDADSFDAGWRSMMERKDSNGEPVYTEPDVLLVGPAQRAVARKLLKQRFKANGEENMNEGDCELLVSPRITGNEWFLVDTRLPVRPVILQVRQLPNFVALDSMDQLHAFMNRTFLYGADMSMGTGYGLWQGTYGSDGTGT